MKTGTKEWAEHNVNIYNGCDNGCRYCYARHNAVTRFKRVESNEAWLYPELAENWEKRCSKKYKGRVMFPSTHDITGKTWLMCVKALHRLLAAGNEVLIVSKPNYLHMRYVLESLTEYRDKITLRYTIGSQNNNVLAYWEPNAPMFGERLDALQWAYDNGWNTSVSIEPMLEPYTVVELYHILAPYVNDTIWIGKMKGIRQRVPIETKGDEQMVYDLEEAQCDGQIMLIYLRLKKIGRAHV